MVGHDVCIYSVLQWYEPFNERKYLTFTMQVTCIDRDNQFDRENEFELFYVIWLSIYEHPTRKII